MVSVPSRGTLIPKTVIILAPKLMTDRDLVPSGLCRFDSDYHGQGTDPEPEQKIYFKHDPHCVDFLIAFGSSRGIRAWANSAYDIKKPGHYTIPAKIPYLADLVSPVTQNQFIELFVDCAEPHPAADWLLFNLDLIREIQ